MRAGCLTAKVQNRGLRNRRGFASRLATLTTQPSGVSPWAGAREAGESRREEQGRARPASGPPRRKPPPRREGNRPTGRRSPRGWPAPVAAPRALGGGNVVRDTIAGRARSRCGRPVKQTARPQAAKLRANTTSKAWPKVHFRRERRRHAPRLRHNRRKPPWRKPPPTGSQPEPESTTRSAASCKDDLVLAQRARTSTNPPAPIGVVERKGEPLHLKC